MFFLNLLFSCKGFLLTKGAYMRQRKPDLLNQFVYYPVGWKWNLLHFDQSGPSDYNWQRQEAFKCQGRVKIITKPLESASSCVSSALGCLVTGVIEQLSRIGKPITLSMKNAGGWLIFWHDHHLRLRLLEDPEIKIHPLRRDHCPKNRQRKRGQKKMLPDCKNLLALVDLWFSVFLDWDFRLVPLHS